MRIRTIVAPAAYALVAATQAAVIVSNPVPVTDIGTATANSTGIVPYATDGFYLFATGSGPSTLSPTAGLDLSRLPAYVESLATGGENAATGFGYAPIQAPLAGTVTTGTLTGGTDLDKFSFLLRAPLNGSIPFSLTIGLLVDNLNSPGFNSTALFVGDSSNDLSFVNELPGNDNPDLYFFTVNGAVAGDVITVGGSAGSFGSATIAGITFATNAPEPTALVLLGVASATLLGRRRLVRKGSAYPGNKS